MADFLGPFGVRGEAGRPLACIPCPGRDYPPEERCVCRQSGDFDCRSPFRGVLCQPSIFSAAVMASSFVKSPKSSFTVQLVLTQSRIVDRDIFPPFWDGFWVAITSYYRYQCGLKGVAGGTQWLIYIVEMGSIHRETVGGIQET